MMKRIITHFIEVAKLYYHSLSHFYFIYWWIVFLAVLILFTGGWYDIFFKECKQESFSGITILFIVLSGFFAFSHTRHKIEEREKYEQWLQKSKEINNKIKMNESK
jgi:UDP-N-acetylmuramyl pentapeptide phosphotransferase/UDP-N-acetylglucosamine-1-phosphate transferase